MKSKEIIKLGKKLGLKFNPETNFKDQIDKDFVVFDGANGQRFGIDGKLSKDEILEELGDALITYGKRLKCVEISRVLSINSD